jgi:peptidyl-tRNA hydrolase, PTH1 family
MSITCFVGLGNPGDGYKLTRHNVGFWFIERLAKEQGAVLRRCAQAKGRSARLMLADHRIHLFCPSVFMNHNGSAIAAYCRYHQIPPDALMVVHDDLDFAPGVVRLKKSGGAGGHNGLRDVTSAMGSADYCRMRFGIGRGPDLNRTSDYVLGKPSRSDTQAIDGAITQMLHSVSSLITEPWDVVVERVHSQDQT